MTDKQNLFPKIIPIGAISTLSAYALARRHISSEQTFLLMYSAISALTLVPWTILVIMPVNYKLKDISASKNTELAEGELVFSRPLVFARGEDLEMI